jgi:hypothetical protein
MTRCLSVSTHTQLILCYKMHQTVRACLVARVNSNTSIPTEISENLRVWYPGFLSWALPMSHRKELSALPEREARIELLNSAGLDSPANPTPRPPDWPESNRGHWPPCSFLPRICSPSPDRLRPQVRPQAASAHGLLRPRPWPSPARRRPPPPPPLAVPVRRRRRPPPPLAAAA